MKIIKMERRTGKSSELIELSNSKWYYILCPNHNRAKYLVRQAENMGLDIPFPLTPKDLPLHSPYIRGILIDDVDEVIQGLIGQIPVIQCTTSCEVEIRETTPQPICKVDPNDLFA